MPKKKIIQDERIASLTNTFAAKAFLFLAYYLVISVVVKGFIIDTPFFLYWDVVIVMALAGFYVIYRSASKGVPVDPASVKLFDKTMLKGFGISSILFGLFVIFFAVPRHEEWPNHFPGISEKFIGVLIIAIGFFVLMTTVFWLIDYLPTKLAFKKSKELSGDQDDELIISDFIENTAKVKDERIESTQHEYAAHGFYVLFAYIIFSTFIKNLTLDIPMMHYFDAFIVAIFTGGYFTVKMLRAGIFVTGITSKSSKSNIWSKIIGSLVFGMLMAFVVNPLSESMALNLESFTARLFATILWALFFGVGMFFYDWVANRNAERLMEDD